MTRTTIAAILLALSVQTAAAQEVGLWERFEADVPNTTAYADPYADVRLDVTYTRPDSSTVDFWGFYDGDSTWRTRFMPDQLGTWRYDARFSDGSAGSSGTFEVVPSDVPGMLSLDEENSIWFGYKGGDPVLVRSFHVGDRFFATNWDDPADTTDGDRRTSFLDWVEEQGYNTLSVASHYLNREVEGRGLGWETPDLWDGARGRPDPAEYGEMERLLDTLAARRLMVYPFAGFFGKEADFPREEAAQERYVRYTLARIGPYWNILLLVGGPEPLYKRNPHLTAEEVHRLGRLIQEMDVFGHPLSVHNPTGDDPFMEAPWLSYGVLQGPKTTDLEELSGGLLKNHHPSKPLYAQETLWPGNTYGHPDHTPETVRKNAFVINMSATALNYADMDGNSSSGFSGSLDLADRKPWGHDAVKAVWDVFETLPFYRMRPRQDLVSSGYALAEEGARYLVYLPEGGRVDVHLEGGPYAVEWINAQDGSDRRRGEATSDGQDLRAPSGGDDWLLYLTRSGGTSAAAPRGHFRETDGLVVIEAEHYAEGAGWERVGGRSGGAMRDDTTRGDGFLEYDITFTQPGDYRITTLARKTNREHADKANDVFVTLGGEKLWADDDVTRPDGLRTGDYDFGWTSWPKGPGAHTPRPLLHRPVYARVPEPGTYALRFTSRSPGYELDKVVLSLDPDLELEGAGPAETVE